MEPAGGYRPAVEHGGIGWTTHGCTVLDNFYVERPVWMVDLGKKTTVSGVIIFTWPGNPNGKFYAVIVKSTV